MSPHPQHTTSSLFAQRGNPGPTDLKTDHPAEREEEWPHVTLALAGETVSEHQSAPTPMKLDVLLGGGLLGWGAVA